MTDQRLYLAIGVPLLANFVSLMAAVFSQTKRFEDLRDVIRAEMATLRAELGAKIDVIGVRWTAVSNEMAELKFRAD